MDFPGLISCFASSVLVIQTFIIPTRIGQCTNISLAAEVKFSASTATLLSSNIIDSGSTGWIYIQSGSQDSQHWR